MPNLCSVIVNENVRIHTLNLITSHDEDFIANQDALILCLVHCTAY